LELVVQPPTGIQGQTIGLSVGLRQDNAPVLGASVAAAVYKPGGVSETVSLLDTTSVGRYTATFANTTTCGVYRFEVLAVGSTAAGPFVRGEPRVVEICSPAQTAVVTPTPGLATLNGTVGLQGLEAGTSRYQVPLVVQLLQPGTDTVLGTFPTTTDLNGRFSVSGIAPRDYDIKVKETRRISRIARSVTLAIGSNTRAFGELAAGDVNEDDAVALVDYSRMRASFGKCSGAVGYQAGADFTGDDCVTLPDYSRLRANYGIVGPLNAP
jgi:hypothetical protein